MSYGDHPTLTEAQARAAAASCLNGTIGAAHPATETGLFSFTYHPVDEFRAWEGQPDPVIHVRQVGPETVSILFADTERYVRIPDPADGAPEFGVSELSVAAERWTPIGLREIPADEKDALLLLREQDLRAYTDPFAALLDALVLLASGTVRVQGEADLEGLCPVEKLVGALHAALPLVRMRRLGTGPELRAAALESPDGASRIVAAYPVPGEVLRQLGSLVATAGGEDEEEATGRRLLHGADRWALLLAALVAPLHPLAAHQRTDVMRAIQDLNGCRPTLSSGALDALREVLEEAALREEVVRRLEAKTASGAPERDPAAEAIRALQPLALLDPDAPDWRVYDPSAEDALRRLRGTDLAPGEEAAAPVPGPRG